MKGDRPLEGELKALVTEHDAALFLRAFPRSPGDLAVSESRLRAVAARVREISRAGTDLSPLDDFETSGIAGTSIAMDFSWGMARWLSRRHPRVACLSWDGEDAADRLGATLPRFLPFLEERALVDSGIDFRSWFDAALPPQSKCGGLRWLLDLFEGAAADDAARAELWDALGLLVRWDLGGTQIGGSETPSRTFTRLPAGKPFVDAGPLVARRDVSIAAACADPPTPRPLSSRPGVSFLDAARAAVGVRYRELHAFTWGNPADAFVADCGRGLRIWCCGLLPEMRLPLRAGYGYLLARNGVPIGYGDAYALGDRLDLAFNVFYSFRDGESAYAYARTVAFFFALLGTRSLAVDPYQFGKGNEEAIASGAFWFYRKLGFRPADPALEELALREEARVARRKEYRTPAATLRELARAPLLLDLPGGAPGAWDRFSLDAVGLAVQRRMSASRLGPEAFRAATAARVGSELSLGAKPGPALARALRGLAPVLSLLPRPLNAETRAALRAVVRAKAGPSEVPYVAGFARCPGLREGLLRV